MFERIRRWWDRNAWEAFLIKLDELQPAGSRAWRKASRVTRGDALQVVKRRAFGGVTVAYADPPYTKDQYSRYYHVYETMYLYDYPASVGVGRYRGDRLSTEFSILSKVTDAFGRLFSALAARRIVLVLSYPENGLLTKSGKTMREILRLHFAKVTESTIPIDHSTMGASRRRPTKPALEKIYVAYP